MKNVENKVQEKFDALGNKIIVETVAADIDRDMIKRMTKQLKGLKDRFKKGDASVEDEMYELEEKLDRANAILKKEKEAEKDALKGLEKKDKKSKATACT